MNEGFWKLPQSDFDIFWSFQNCHFTLPSFRRSFKTGGPATAHLHKLGFYLEQHAPRSWLDFSQTSNNPRVTLKTYPRNWSVCLMSTHADLPYLVSAPWILRDFTPCKERENECTGFRSTLSPLVGKVFGGRVLCCIHLCKPRSWCGARHTEGTEVSRVFSPAGGVRGPRIPPASTRICPE